MERHNGLLKSGLKSDTNSLWGWSVCLWTMLQCLNDRSQKGALSPVDMFTHMAASPIQLQVQTKEESLKPRFSHQNNILLPAPPALNPRDSIEWTWPWSFRHMEQQWLALLAPWGQGLEAGLLCIPGITAEWPRKVTVVYPEQPEGRSILPESSVLALWPVHAPPVALYIDPSVTPTGKGVKVRYTRPGKDLLSATGPLSCMHST